MRRFTLSLLALSVLPLAAMALDFTDSTGHYADAPFSRPEAAGISVLTNLGAVQGNPDGTFAPGRPVNRAEFLKILFLSHPDIIAIESDADDCFPDVKRGDWFSQYVCLAKKRGAVGGYPDGNFRPGNTVNYAEALKMLSELYGISHADAPKSPWYERYVWAARDAGLLIPATLQYDAPLTRGQVARLAASFRAYSEGELAEYRTLESGARRRSSSSSAASSPSSSVSSTSSLSSASSLSSISSISSSLYPAKSHFLLGGRQTPILFDGTFTATEQDAWLRSVSLTLKNEIESIKELSLVDAAGKEVIRMRLDTLNNANNLRWIGDVGTGALKLVKDEPVLLGVRAMLYSDAEGGASKELFDLDTYAGFYIYVEETVTVQRRQLFPSDPHYPQSETAQAVITRIQSTLPEGGTLFAGKNRTIGAFTFSGTVMPSARIQLNTIEFRLAAHGVVASGWRIGGPSELEQAFCGVEGSDRTQIFCPTIPEKFQTVSDPGTVVTLYADLTVDSNATDPYLQVSLVDRGKIGESGDIWWSDGFGDFRWIEDTVVMPAGPRWTISK